MHIDELPTPALWANLDVLESNIAEWPEDCLGIGYGLMLRLTNRLLLLPSNMRLVTRGFTCATPREVLGLAQAGLGDDLLLANETVDVGRLTEMATSGARVTVAVDSEATIAAAAKAGIKECVIDIRVGFRCGCEVDEAHGLAQLARKSKHWCAGGHGIRRPCNGCG